MKQGERGLTIIELVVVIAISAIIAAGTGMTTVQIINGSEDSQDLVTVANQTHNAGYWVSRDIMTAQSANVSDDPGTAESEFAVIAWKDLETGDTYDIRYIWLASTDSLQMLKRKQIIRNNDGVVTSNKTTLVADNIYSANLTQVDTGWKLAVEAQSGEKSLTREYIIGQRPVQ